MRTMCFVAAHVSTFTYLYRERGGREMTKQRLRTQVQNIEKKKFLSDVKIGQIA